jgi:hypothetical protein
MIFSGVEGGRIGIGIALKIDRTLFAFLLLFIHLHH